MHILDEDYYFISPYSQCNKCWFRSADVNEENICITNLRTMTTEVKPWETSYDYLKDALKVKNSFRGLTQFSNCNLHKDVNSFAGEHALYYGACSNGISDCFRSSDDFVGSMTSRFSWFLKESVSWFNYDMVLSVDNSIYHIYNFFNKEENSLMFYLNNKDFFSLMLHGCTFSAFNYESIYIEGNLLILVAEVVVSFGSIYIRFKISDSKICFDFYFSDSDYSRIVIEYNNSQIISYMFKGNKEGYPLETKYGIENYLLKLKLLGA